MPALGCFGGAEESSISQVKGLFDVNVFGTVRVTNAVALMLVFGIANAELR